VFILWIQIPDVLKIALLTFPLSLMLLNASRKLFKGNLFTNILEISVWREYF
jgi:hypothetical protein